MNDRTQSKIKFIIVYTIISSILIVVFMAYAINNSIKIKELENSFYAPVVVTPSLEVSDKHTQDIVKQAYQCFCKAENIVIFDFKYELTFGGNESNQRLIFITFYYSLKNDPHTYKAKLVNYYENPQEWEIIYHGLYN